MDFGFLLHTLLPVVSIVASIASVLAHRGIAAAHKADHKLVIDDIAAAIKSASEFANPTAPPAPDAGSSGA